MKFTDWMMVNLWGSKYLEFNFIDTFLEAFEDGTPRTNLPTATGENARIQARVCKYLIDHKLLEPYGNGYVITAQGRMHLSKGGCRGEFLHHKLSAFGFILSLFASVLSIVAMVLALCK